MDKENGFKIHTSEAKKPSQDYEGVKKMVLEKAEGLYQVEMSPAEAGKIISELYGDTSDDALDQYNNELTLKKTFDCLSKQGRDRIRHKEDTQELENLLKARNYIYNLGCELGYSIMEKEVSDREGGKIVSNILGGQKVREREFLIAVDYLNDKIKFGDITEEEARTKQEEAEKKKFKIEQEYNKPEKKKTADQIWHGKQWHQQKNTSDCGPCLILNAVNALELKIPHSNVASIRQDVNNLRRESNLQAPIYLHLDEIPPTGWLTDQDIQRYITKHTDLQVKASSIIDEDDLTYILRQIEARPDNKLIYFTVNKHFRGIAPTAHPDQYLLLDSFQGGPKLINKEEREKFIQSNLSSRRTSSRGEAEVVAIVLPKEEQTKH